ncbi:hypothetical protein Q4555_01750 [Octadecabacter sp. 1_MG-2023]|uniref:hypothetical protein n=1 Tax=unclassified Octadecabacter TaxID=196158 RepID=UPI001C08DB20|nr:MULTISPECIES: hypothetical protein [unclassified Octadecabacter]MBU2993175.1 hypothetical protein [Octadecabacter sp. B2R22]MDO6733373.1 hypothetical protein [Octadecabacter sp. 1_MG-2023]
MAVSTTTFAERMSKINSGNTTSWTVPGQGLATTSDERSFLKKTPVKMMKKSTQKKRNPLIYVAALVAGAGSVIAARWIDFTYFDKAMAFAAEKGVDAASVLSSLPIALSLAVLISLVTMFVLGLTSKRTVPLQMAGFVGAVMFEADLVKLAPEVYARFYPDAWVTEMMASATLLT